MDTKALAKSKRAHSQHHSKRHHSNQTSKTPSLGNVGAGNAKKPPGKQIREKLHQSMDLSRLPSNRDRYVEEFDSGSEEPSISSMNQATDVIVPKSKGADYGELISEAKSQSQSQSNPYFDSFACLDDVLPGMLLILSNVIKHTSCHIVPYLLSTWLRFFNNRYLRTLVRS